MDVESTRLNRTGWSDKTYIVIAAGEAPVHVEVQVQPLELVQQLPEVAGDVGFQETKRAQELHLKDHELPIRYPPPPKK